MSVEQAQRQWQTITLSNVTPGGDQFLPRILPSVCFLNCNEICIMGGMSDEGPLGDVILFDIVNENVKTAVGNFAGLLAFSAPGFG